MATSGRDDRPVSAQLIHPHDGADVPHATAANVLEEEALLAHTSRDQFYHMLAGAGAGCLTAVATCPLDVLKTRLQNEQRNRAGGSILRSLRRIWVREGLGGLYRGLGPAVLGYLPTWAVYFGTYDRYKHLAAHYYGVSLDSLAVHVTGAVGAGVTSTIITNPLWVIKTRMMTQHQTQLYNYRNTLHAFISILKVDGPRGLYKGLSPSLFGVSHVAVQFPLYEHLKTWTFLDRAFDHVSLRGSSSHGDATVHASPSQLTLLFASTASKLVASVTTYPHEVVRTRLQNETTPPTKYSSLGQTFKTILREEGWRGFYKGLATNLVRTVPASAVTLLSYEALVRMFLQLDPS